MMTLIEPEQPHVRAAPPTPRPTQPPPAARGEKPQLSYEELRDVIDLSLWAGQLLLQHGAETDRIEETVHRLGTALGCNWLDVLISPNAIIITSVSGQEFRTKVRRVVSLGVNLNVVAEIGDLSRNVEAGQLNRAQVRAELGRIGKAARFYNRWLTAFMVGLACAAMSRIFGGDWPAFGITLVSSTLAMLTRQELLHRHFNVQLVVVLTSFVAGLLAGAARFLNLSATPTVPLIAAVILLVPGVHLINAVEDMIKGHMVTGAVRGLLAGLTIIGIAFGLLLAMALTGVQGL